MLDRMEQSGCSVPASFFNVQHCDNKIVGGFQPGHGVRHYVSFRLVHFNSTPDGYLLLMLLKHCIILISSALLLFALHF